MALLSAIFTKYPVIKAAARDEQSQTVADAIKSAPKRRFKSPCYPGEVQDPPNLSSPLLNSPRNDVFHTLSSLSLNFANMSRTVRLNMFPCANVPRFITLLQCPIVSFTWLLANLKPLGLQYPHIPSLAVRFRGIGGGYRRYLDNITLMAVSHRSAALPYRPVFRRPTLCELWTSPAKIKRQAVGNDE